MLRITTNNTPAVAKRYYTTADYYSEGQELVGIWRGLGAERLGLTGGIRKDDWNALCDNMNPATGKQLTVRRLQDRRVGYDFNFNVPKSLSLLYGLTQDERLVEALRESVGETMQDMEREIKTRVRKGGKDEDRTSGNMIWGEYVHTTGRPVNGVPDPHLHVHAFVFNATWDEKETRWKAGQFADLKRDAPYFEAAFHARLARKMEELGLATVRTKDHWELADVPSEILQRFSRRTGEIESKAKEKGITDPKLKAELGAKTRKHKQQTHSFEQLQAIWKSWLNPDDEVRLTGLAHNVGSPSLSEDAATARQSVEYAADHCFERSAVVSERRLLTEALKHGVGKASLDSIEADYHRSGFVTGERNGKRMVTTPEVLLEESRMLDFARQGRGSCRKLGGELQYVFKQQSLNDGQRRAVQHILNSHDRVILVRGGAGVGKTWSMREAVDAIEANGKRVFTFAPSADASRGVLRDEAGFADADTVARLLIDEKMQSEIQGQVIWIDEAGLLGTRTMGQVFKLADKLDARIILSGDRRQHGSVERGAALRLLETEAGLVPAEIKEIKRQSGEYKRAVQALSDGHTEDAFQQLDALNWIREIDSADRYKVLAAEYVGTVTGGETALVVSPTHAEGRRITKEIRSELKQIGKLGEDERVFKTLTNANLTQAQRSDPISYCQGDFLVFHQNAKGFRRGQRVVVDDKLDALPLDQATRFQVFESSELRLAAGDVVRITHNGATVDGQHRLNNGALYAVKGFKVNGDIVFVNGWTVSKDFGHLAYGYVVTSHASQGKSVDRVFIGQSSDSFPASSREQFYVSVSRGKKQATIYTDDKGALLAAVNQSDDRLTATEFVTDRQLRNHTLTIHRNQDLAATRDQPRRSRAHDCEMVPQ